MSDTYPTRTPELHRLGLAIVLAGLLAANVAFADALPGPDPVWPGWLVAGMGIVAAATLVTVGRWPGVSLVLLAASTLAYRFGGGPATLLWIAPVVATYAAANTLGRRWGMAYALTLALVLGLPASDSLTAIGVAANVLRSLVLTAGAAAFGEANRSRRERAVEAEARARAAESAREAEARLAVDEERLRIARELHDVTAHSLSVIAIQSELARRSMSSDPDTASAALDAIGTTSRQALGELRGMLGQLRGPQHDVAPAPSLARLAELVAELEAAGVAVTLTDDRPDTELAPFVDASAYRIVQEAVTNVIKHARATRAAIEIGLEPGRLLIRVADDGAGAADGGWVTGHGLLGMSERAAALGGTLEAGPDPAGGWLVHAVLPLPPQGTTDSRRTS